LWRIDVPQNIRHTVTALVRSVFNQWANMVRGRSGRPHSTVHAPCAHTHPLAATHARTHR
jgi:hypothetical protein